MTGRWTCAAIALLTVLASSDARAYSQYSQNRDATNCRACHGDFRAANYTSLVDGQAWGNLHNLHRQTMLNGDCDVCHSSGTFPVLLDSSTGGTGLAAISCVGCHGRDQDNVAANPDFGSMGGRGAGLRQHHDAAGVTACASCHNDADPASYTPVAESVLPAYYANGGTSYPAMPASACNVGFDENFAGSTAGLDNDGDLAADGADPDCFVCGNGIVEGSETCDDGNAANDDACPTGPSGTCHPAACGDGFVRTGIEECDDGNTTPGDGCDASCAIEPPVCGNCTIESGETCDDGNTTPGDGCDASCAIELPAPVCGNGTVEAPEGCDDGNTTPGDGCSATCTVESSGGPSTGGGGGGGGCSGGAAGPLALLSVAMMLPLLRRRRRA